VKYRNVDYAVRESVPRRSRWHILPNGEPGPVPISENQFGAREAAVEACINEIDNRLARTSSVRRRSRQQGESHSAPGTNFKRRN
jgi:hypothetical protein